MTINELTGLDELIAQGQGAKDLWRALNWSFKAYFCILSPMKPILLNLKAEDPSNYQKNTQRPNTKAIPIDWYYFHLPSFLLDSPFKVEKRTRTLIINLILMTFCS
jgi:hypothetical protein